MKRAIIITSIGLSLALASTACGDDDDDGGARLVGGACADHSDCEDRCVRGGDYPGGMCTIDCNDDGDCPGGTACIEDEGGICAVTCDAAGGCGDFGPEWRCESVDHRGEPGDVGVCRGN